MPWENRGFGGDNALIALDKMGTEVQALGKSRQRRPSYIAKLSNMMGGEH